MSVRCPKWRKVKKTQQATTRRKQFLNWNWHPWCWFSSNFQLNEFYRKVLANFMLPRAVDFFLFITILLFIFLLFFFFFIHFVSWIWFCFFVLCVVMSVTACTYLAIAIEITKLHFTLDFFSLQCFFLCFVQCSFVSDSIPSVLFLFFLCGNRL